MELRENSFRQTSDSRIAPKRPERERERERERARKRERESEKERERERERSGEKQFSNVGVTNI
jgi:hypothetical protein